MPPAVVVAGLSSAFLAVRAFERRVSSRLPSVADEMKR
jgi:hypothetical protein